MVPTEISRRGKVIRVIGEKENPGAIQLGRKAFTRVEKHRTKPGHRVFRVSRFDTTVGGVGSHIGPFVRSHQPIGRGYGARWVSEEDVV